ncbi:MAG: zinc-ribbon domain-containing protein [Deltaproteobacteria bacterium]|nr:zinc-ribbon domain-containing protein [Deltaproteobacteria bacterium]
MKCENCGHPYPTITCPHCGEEILKESIYCMKCGAKIVNLETEINGKVETEELDLSKRLLCSDGTCIGVIGEDGRCKICGKPYTGEPSEDS